MDDLVQYYRNIPGRSFPWGEPFTYLKKVEQCLDAVPWRLEECVERVTPLGRADGDYRDLLIPRNGRGLFSILGILQLCLFGCKSFHGLTELKVKDLRPKVPKPRERIQDCPHRPDLLDSLAVALLDLESLCRFDPTSWVFFAAARDRSRDFHQQVESLLMEHRRRETSLTDPTLHHQSGALIRAMQWVDDMLSHIQPTDIPPRDITFDVDVILRVMASGFRTFGPSTFTQGAIHYALADILRSLGATNERGKLLKAAGIKGRLRRIPAAVRRSRTRDGDKNPEKP